MQNVSAQTIRRTVSAHRFELISAAVLGLSGYYTVTLAVVHNSGPELYGVLTAALATLAAGSNVALLRSPRVRLIATGIVIVIWAVVALAGFVGVIAHLVGPVPGHGPVDLRPRPIAAPLVFTLLGTVGAAALVVGQRTRMRAASTSEKE